MELVRRAIDRTACGSSSGIRLPRPGRTAALGARAVLSSLSRPALLVLALFHGWLFWNRLADGRLLEPAVAFRWIAGALILCGFLALRRLGASPDAGRRSLVLWVFVILLHCQAIGASSGAGLEPAVLPETVAALGANLALVTAATTLGLALLARSSSGDATRFPALRGVVFRAPAPAAPSAGFLPQFSSRPPPA